MDTLAGEDLINQADRRSVILIFPLHGIVTHDFLDRFHEDTNSFLYIFHTIW